MEQGRRPLLVEREAVQSGAAEQLKDGLAAKALQAALGVTERQAEERLDGAVEQPAGQPAGPASRWPRWPVASRWPPERRRVRP
jgi:hypothetical protein